MEDRESGDVVCASCGFVLAERTEMGGPEWRNLGPEETLERERTGPPLSFRRADLGLATSIGRKQGAEKLRFWEKRTFYTRRQRSLKEGLKLVENLASKLDLGRTATDQAAYVYRKAARAGFLRGHSTKLVAAAAVYLSCRESGIPKTLDALAQVSGVGKRVLAREYRDLVESFEVKVPILEPERYAAKIASDLSINEKTTRKAYSILRKAKRNGLAAGKDPKGLASAALYLATLSAEKHPSQEELAKSAGVTSFTLRKSAHLLKKYLENKLSMPVAASAPAA
jgi:transcription initiation factor TFIIB